MSEGTYQRALDYVMTIPKVFVRLENGKMTPIMSTRGILLILIDDDAHGIQLAGDEERDILDELSYEEAADITSVLISQYNEMTDDDLELDL